MAREDGCEYKGKINTS